MSRNRAFQSILAVCFFVCAIPAVADGDPVAAGLKLGLEKSVGTLAGMGYKTNCKAKDLDYKSDDSWYCGVFASLSGEGEKEFKERLLHNMEKIRSSLANIENGIAEIQRQQQATYELNQIILLKLDEVGPETTIGKNISRIRTVYDEQFSRMFRNPVEGSTQPSTLNPERMRAFARQIIFTDRMDNLLGVIHDQLVRSQIAGKDPLLRAYAKRAFEQIKNDPAKGLEPAYIYLESAVDGLLADQRKGYVLYVWAAETLQSDCEVATTEAAAGKITAAEADTRCKPFREFPHTADEYRATFAEHVRVQLNELNAALEYQVLAASDSHARQANFITAAAEPLFRRVDLFTAGNLEEGFGIRGRVITMGDTFNGNLSIAGTRRAPAGTANTVPTRGGRVDWWKASSTPGAYDQIQFGDEWKIYHYYVPSATAGTYSIDTALPHRPQISVASITLGTGDTQTSVPFGSFTAIDRAGGGYALLSGEWELVTKDDIKWNGGLTEGWNERYFDAAKSRAGMLYSGSLEWQAAKAPKDQYIEVDKYSYARSKKRIRYPKGGELMLHGSFGDTLPKVCPGGACADYGNNQVLNRGLDLSKPVFGGRSASASVRAALVIDNDGAAGTNGLVWEKSGTTDTKFEDRLNAGNDESKRIRLDNSGTFIHYGGGVKMNAQTSTTSQTRWWMFGLIFIENAWLTE
jgi:hypothetical protein